MLVRNLFSQVTITVKKSILEWPLTVECNGALIMAQVSQGGQLVAIIFWFHDALAPGFSDFLHEADRHRLFESFVPLSSRPPFIEVLFHGNREEHFWVHNCQAIALVSGLAQTQKKIQFFY